MCREPLCPLKVLPLMARPLGSRRKALPSLHRSYWLMGRTKTLPHPSAFAWSVGLCRLQQAPAGRWPIPALSPQSLYRCLDPYPAVSPQCIRSLLPGGQRPHLTPQRFGTLKILLAMQLLQGLHSRSCSHSVMFRLPYSPGPQVAPTAEALSLQGSRAGYTTQ